MILRSFVNTYLNDLLLCQLSFHKSCLNGSKKRPTRQVFSSPLSLSLSLSPSLSFALSLFRPHKKHCHFLVFPFSFCKKCICNRSCSISVTFLNIICFPSFKHIYTFKLTPTHCISLYSISLSLAVSLSLYFLYTFYSVSFYLFFLCIHSVSLFHFFEFTTSISISLSFFSMHSLYLYLALFFLSTFYS